MLLILLLSLLYSPGLQVGSARRRCRLNRCCLSVLLALPSRLTLHALQSSAHQVLVAQHAQVGARALRHIGVAHHHQVAILAAQVAANMAELHAAAGEYAACLGL